MDWNGIDLDSEKAKLEAQLTASTLETLWCELAATTGLPVLRANDAFGRFAIVIAALRGAAKLYVDLEAAKRDLDLLTASLEKLRVVDEAFGELWACANEFVNEEISTVEGAKVQLHAMLSETSLAKTKRVG